MLKNGNCAKALKAKCHYRISHSLNKPTISNADLPSYAPYGHRSRSEKDINEFSFCEGATADVAR